MPQVNLHNINWEKWISRVVILVLVCYSFVQCENNKTALANIDALNSKISTYELENGQLVSSNLSLQFDKDQLEDLVISQDKELEEIYKKFSEVKTVTKTVTITKIDSVDVPFEVKVPCDFERSDSVIDKHYSFDYAVNQNGLKIKNLTIPDSVSIVTGSKRKWFLGKKTYTIDITHSNPNIQETSLQHYEVQEPKKWYQTDGAKMGGAIIIFEVLKSVLIK